MLKVAPLAEWLPDQPNDGLNVAKNVYPIADGYAPVKGFSSITSTLGAAFVGGGSFIGSDGNSTLLAATPAKLRKYSGSWTDVLAVNTTQRWHFTQFGDNVVYANGAQLGRYQLLPGTAGVLSGSPTNAIDVATVKDFVMCLTADSQAVWSDFNNCTVWTAGTGQSDFQPLLDGGTGVRIIGGEYGIILQKNSIRRVTYVGAPVIFQFDVISPEVGCMAAGSVANVGRLIFFLSERGFEMCDGENVTPIADEKFNRWFFAKYSRADIANMWSAIDPRRPIVLWAMPGTPGLIIAYNWVLKRASYIETNVTGIMTGRTSNVSVDALDATYPGGIDTVPISLDDVSLQGGNPLLFLVDGNNSLGAMEGANLAATVGQNNVELAEGARSRVRSIRPVTDAPTASASLNVKMNAGDKEFLRFTSAMRSNGKMPIRANGRYYDTLLTIPAATSWSYAKGIEYEFERGDGR